MAFIDTSVLCAHSAIFHNWSILTLVSLLELGFSSLDDDSTPAEDTVEGLLIRDNWQSWLNKFNPNIEIVSGLKLGSFSL